MRILILNWKDRKNPLAGGAEIVTEELLKRLVKNGHQATLLTSKFKGCQDKEIIDGCKVIRVGNKWTVYWQAYQYYKKHLQGKFDLVVDEINTIPFFARFYVKEKNILFVHQLCREIWFYQIPFPLNLIGYLMEPLCLWLLRNRKVVAVSESTRKDLLRYGFKKENIHIIPEGIEIEPLKELPPMNENIRMGPFAYPETKGRGLGYSHATKEKNPTVLFLGAIRAMKRPHQAIEAFEIAKKDIKSLKLWIVGNGKGRYFEKVIRLIDKSRHKKDISYFGKVTKERKTELLQKAHLLCSTSVKEGWGLVVAEANSQGTPAIVYNVDGLRDAVKNNETGIICRENTSSCLAGNIVKLLNDRELYNNLRVNAWNWSKEINFERSYQDFIRTLLTLDMSLPVWL